MREKIWTPASTDITIRWRRLYGYVPASEQAFYKQKWAEWRALLAKGIDDLTPEKVEANLIQMRKRK